MSDKDETEPPKSQVFNIRDFMDFLAGQDISKLAVLTKSGTLLSASFNNEPSGSMDSSILKTLFKSMEQHTSSDNLAGQHTISLETSQIPESVAKACNSRDWAVEYEKSHVDVTYNHFFSISEHGEKPSQIPSTALPPKKRHGKTDWNAMYADALSPLVEAAARATPAEEPEENRQGSSVSSPVDSNLPQKQAKRKPRKIVPQVKTFVEEYRDIDVLFGRGGRSNHVSTFPCGCKTSTAKDIHSSSYAILFSLPISIYGDP